jgi:hypothetical protein
MKYFVAFDQRRFVLEEQLLRQGITDVEWAPPEPEGFIDWLHKRTREKLSRVQLSNTVKHMWALSRMVRGNIQEAIIIENDVLFHRDFSKLVIPQDGSFQFVRLGIGASYATKPGLEPTKQLAEFVAGSEAQYVTLEFAKSLLCAVAFNVPIDVVYWGHLTETNAPWCFIPACHQASILEDVATGVRQGARDMLRNWGSVTKYNWSSIVREFKEIARIESEFEEVFGRYIKITNVDYLQACASRPRPR